MTAIPSQTLTKIKASLANSAHAWTVTAAQEHESTSQTAGNGDPPTFSTDIKVTRTYQLHAPPLALFLTFMVEIVNGSLDHIAVNWNGQAWTTTDSALKTTLETMAGPVAAAKAAALEAIIS